jgi:hypothetical protein
MAERPIFVPVREGTELVRELFFQFTWHAGFAQVQKEKNIEALHAAAAAGGYSPLLEVSTKSERKVGRHLSAFHLKVQSMRCGEIPLECAFQGSKIFERGGPFTDLYKRDVREAKGDPRLKDSGALVGFKFDGLSFPLEPKTIFYDWLYVNSIYPHREWCRKLDVYAGFTDIEFNPYRSINCQARSCALFLTLMNRGLLGVAVNSPEDFIRIISGYKYRPQLRIEDGIHSTVLANLR